MDLRQLRYFCSIYENKGLSAAAEVERIAVSALSYHLNNLEAEIGSPLFFRKSRGLETTAAGERMYSHAKTVLKAVEVAKRDLSTFRDDISGEVSLAMAYSAVQAIGVELAKRVVNDYPRLRLNLIESLSSTTLLHLSSADADLGLAYNPPLTEALKTTPVPSTQGLHLMPLPPHKNLDGFTGGVHEYQRISVACGLAQDAFTLGRIVPAKEVEDDRPVVPTYRSSRPDRDDLYPK